MKEGRMNILAEWSFFYKLLLNINSMEISFEKEIWKLLVKCRILAKVWRANGVNIVHDWLLLGKCAIMKNI